MSLLGDANQNLLSVRLHIALLEIGSEAVKILIVRKKSMGFSTVKVSVKNTKKSKDDWNVLVQGSVAEVLIHEVSTLQKLFEVCKANVQ